ncbi:MAG TPA: hypothetical protein VGW31_03785 [Hanamia sp.]|nr:hypothetical protein [Hanamia sp.]
MAVVIHNDTITVKIPPGVNPVNAIPDIEFSGKSMPSNIPSGQSEFMASLRQLKSSM